MPEALSLKQAVNEPPEPKEQIVTLFPSKFVVYEYCDEDEPDELSPLLQAVKNDTAVNNKSFFNLCISKNQFELAINGYQRVY